MASGAKAFSLRSLTAGSLGSSRGQFHTARPTWPFIRGLLINLGNARAFHDWGLLLPKGEGLGPFAVDVNPREFFAVVVIDGDLPMAVPPSAVAPFGCGFPLSRFLLHMPSLGEIRL